MNVFSFPDNSDDITELEQRFTLDSLDNWNTSAGLVESAIHMIQQTISGAECRVFVHVPEAREYREIDREGIASIPDDSLFSGCLAMCDTGLSLDQFFSEFALEDPLLHELLTVSYGAYYIYPIVHRFSLLAFILLCQPAINLLNSPMTASRDHIDFLDDVASRMKINLYASSIADRRQRELIGIARFPARLKRHHSIAELSSHILEDLAEQIPFDRGVYYEFDEYLHKLIPAAWSGIPTEPGVLESGKGVSGHAVEKRRALYIPDRSKHPSFSFINEEAFIQGSFISAPVCTDKRVIGVITIARKPESGESFGVEHRYTLEIAAAFTASEISSRRLYDELEQSYFSTVASLSRALEAKDEYTRGHSERVMTYAVGIARTLKLSPESVRRIRYAAILHDIGKIGISDSIICKPSSLTDIEYAEIKRHTEIGYDIVNSGSFFAEIRDLIKYHHEKLDGSGYYAKHRGDYPWEAMIISLADIYDALTSDRPYREAFPREKALETLKEVIGISFDDRIYDAFTKWLVHSETAHPS